jgi:hypothetical protein
MLVADEGFNNTDIVYYFRTTGLASKDVTHNCRGATPFHSAGCVRSSPLPGAGAEAIHAWEGGPNGKHSEAHLEAHSGTKAE